MKIIVSNYTSPQSTEPIYFSEILNRLEDVECSVWNSNTSSAYDLFDTVKPDLYITHYKNLQADVAKYLSQNNNIDLVMNITGATQEDLDNINNIIKQANISCPFLFTNQAQLLSRYNVNPSYIKVENIMGGADMFINRTPPIEFSVEAAIISNVAKEDNTIYPDYKSYHKILLGNEPNDKYDISMPAVRFTSICNNYGKVVFEDDIQDMFSQVLFDALLSANTFDVSTDNENEFWRVMGSIFSGDIKDIDQIKTEIKSKHTCFNRASRLLDRLKMKDQSIKVRGMKI